MASNCIHEILGENVRELCTELSTLLDPKTAWRNQLYRPIQAISMRSSRQIGWTCLLFIFIEDSSVHSAKGGSSFRIEGFILKCPMRETTIRTAIFAVNLTIGSTSSTSSTVWSPHTAASPRSKIINVCLSNARLLSKAPNLRVLTKWA